ncbi:MAG: hypothetical protein EXS63_02775 [Candidatus Omnitrophica bacterium]|nr:hypothetical protein [Candidatus Omnitrophota bacterium]
MKEFLVGLLMLFVFSVLSLLGFLLVPLLLVLGLFLRLILSFILILFAVWLIGKATLMSIEIMRNK